MASKDSSIEGLKGTWDYVSGENFNEVLKELGINKVLRTLAKGMKPRLTISESNGKWSFKSETTFKTTAYEFFPNVEFEDIGHDGEKYRLIIKLENGKWIQTVYCKNGKEMLIERWINDKGQLQTIMKCGKAQSTELFRRSH